MNTPGGQVNLQGGSTSAGSYDRISYTASKVLQKKALHTTIPYAREMADAAGVKWRVSWARAWARRLLWGGVHQGEFLQFRYDSISSALAGYPRSAVLEIGAGFCTRGLVESAEREAYVESDLPGVIARKPQLVQTVLSTRPTPNHHFLEINACDASDMQKAASFLIGLKLSKPLVVVNEGILIYLDDREQRAFRDNVRAILTTCSPGGAWITTDFSERDRPDTVLQALVTRQLTRTTGRLFNRFQTDRAVLDFLEEGGLTGEKLASPARNHPDAEARDVADTFRAWRIRLAAEAKP